MTPSQGYDARPGGGHDEDADLAMAMHLQAQFEEVGSQLLKPFFFDSHDDSKATYVCTCNWFVFRL